MNVHEQKNVKKARMEAKKRDNERKIQELNRTMDRIRIADAKNE